MTNGDLYRTLLYIANKESRGGVINTDDFNRQLRAKNIVLLKEKLGSDNTMQTGVPLAVKQKATSTLLDDQTNVFKLTASLTFVNGIAPLPTNYFRYVAVRAPEAKEDVNVLFSEQVGRMLENPIDKPDHSFPIGEFMGNSFIIYPNDIKSATLVYYRVPKEPHFDFYIDAIGEIQYLDAGVSYTLKDGEVYSDGTTSGTVASKSIELEWMDPEKLELLAMVIADLGINLSRQDLVSLAVLGKGGAE